MSDVRDRAAVVAGDARVELVATARDEAVGEVEVDLLLEPADARAGQLADLGAGALHQLRRRLDRRRGRAPGSSGSRAPPPWSAAARSSRSAGRSGASAGRPPRPPRRARPGARPRPRSRRATNLKEFMFLSSVFVRKPVLAGLAHRDVGVAAQRALLHLGVGDAELDDRLAQELEEAPRLLAGADVRLGHDLDERRAAAVEVDERRLGAADPAGRAADVDRLRRVLLEVRADDPDLAVAVRAQARRSGPPRRAGRRTGRSGTPSAGRDRSSSSGGRASARRSRSRARGRA